MTRYTNPYLHAHCKMIPYMQDENVKFDWSHEPKPPCRFFGRFRCQTCSNSWASDWTWQGRGQKCRNCTDEFGLDTVDYTFPYVVGALMRPVQEGPIGSQTTSTRTVSTALSYAAPSREFLVATPVVREELDSSIPLGNEYTSRSLLTHLTLYLRILFLIKYFV